MPAALPVGQRIAGNRQGVGFTAPGCEENLLGLHTDGGRNAFPGLFQQPAGAPAQRMQAVRIAIQITHQMPIYTSNLWVNRGCRGIVEINHPAVFITAGSFRAISFS